MTTPDWLTGFEHGVATPVTNGGGLASAVVGSPTIQATYKNSGNYGLRCNPTVAAATNIQKLLTTGQTHTIGRLYVMFHAWPSAKAIVVTIGNAAGAPYGLISLDTADNKLEFAISTSAQKYGTALSLDTWYRIDFDYYVGATTHTLDAKVDGSAITQVSSAGRTITSSYSIRLGFTDVVTGDVIFDDVYVSVTAGDYSIGPGGTEGLVPSADGTHNSGTMIKNTGGTVIDGTVGKTAYTELDEIPLSDTATYVQQDATGTGNYAEVQFGDTARTNILGVQAILAYKAAGTSANNGQTRIRDNAGQETTVYSGDMSESSVFYKGVIVTTPVAGWSQTTVNGLLGRVGYSSDANPIPQWCGLILEVAYATAAAYTLPADKATFNETGIATGLLTARLLPTAQASFAETGQAVNLVHGYALLANVATYTHTGYAINLLAALKLPAVQAAFTFTGQAVAFTKGYGMNVSAAAFSLTGWAANLLAARQLPATNAAFSLNGQVINLLTARRLSLAAGDYSLTGYAAVLTYTPIGGSYTLTADRVSFSLMGYAIAFAYQRAPVTGLITRGNFRAVRRIKDRHWRPRL